MAFANITPEAESDGVVYANGVALTSTEANLGDAVETPNIIPIVEGQTIVAVVRLSVNGLIVGNTTYVVMQTDLGDGTWIDVAWCVYTSTQVAQTFVLCGGGLGAMNNAFQQTRNTNQPPTPQANGSNAVPLGGRVRFVGKTTMVGGSSSLSGVPTAVSATITYRLQKPR